LKWFWFLLFLALGVFAQAPPVEIISGNDAVFSYREDGITKTDSRQPRDVNRISVLFIGNSLVYYNSVPQITAALAATENKQLHVNSVTLGGASLEQLWYETDALKIIWREHWDYVVVQGGGGRLSPLTNAREFGHYLTRFVQHIRASGAEPLYYMVWRQNDTTAHNVASTRVAKRMGMRVIPAGVAWQKVVSTTHIERLDIDGTHQDALGAYLIACATFSTIYDKPSPDGPIEFRKFAQIGADYDMALRTQRITPAQAQLIRDVVWKVIESMR